MKASLAKDLKKEKFNFLYNIKSIETIILNVIQIQAPYLGKLKKDFLAKKLSRAVQRTVWNPKHVMMPKTLISNLAQYPKQVCKQAPSHNKRDRERACPSPVPQASCSVAESGESSTALRDQCLGFSLR